MAQSSRKDLDEVCQLALFYHALAVILSEENCELRDRVEWLNDYLNERDRTSPRWRRLRSAYEGMDITAPREARQRPGKPPPPGR